MLNVTPGVVAPGVVVTTPGISSVPIVNLTNESIAQYLLNMQQQQQLIQQNLMVKIESRSVMYGYIY
jgi:hypothetical protein